VPSVAFLQRALSRLLTKSNRRAPLEHLFPQI
jgi:hypothetical protein